MLQYKCYYLCKSTKDYLFHSIGLFSAKKSERLKIGEPSGEWEVIAR